MTGVSGSWSGESQREHLLLLKGIVLHNREQYFMVYESIYFLLIFILKVLFRAKKVEYFNI